MELVLIRHALPTRHTVVGGGADPGLAPDGMAQSERLADHLADEPIAAVHCSPMRRARETAAPVAARHGLEVRVWEDLAECDRLAEEYVPIEELRAAGDPRWEAMTSGGWAFDEDPDEFRRRVVAVIEALIDAHPGEVAVVVCHGGVINAYVAHLLGRADMAGLLAPDYTSIHRVAASRRGHRGILTLNETPHLRGSGLPVGLFRRG